MRGHIVHGYLHVDSIANGRGQALNAVGIAGVAFDVDALIEVSNALDELISFMKEA